MLNILTMRNHPALVALVALGTHFGFGGAQLMSYVTSIVTECLDPLNPAVPYAAETTPAQYPQGTVAYDMPSCHCGCPTCTFTSTYTTAYPIFCSTGLTQQAYTITETYAGMSALPTFEPTETPYGFTVAEATHTPDGAPPLVQTMTYPSGASPYYTGPDSPAVIGTAKPTYVASLTQAVPQKPSQYGSSATYAASIPAGPAASTPYHTKAPVTVSNTPAKNIPTILVFLGVLITTHMTVGSV